MQPTNIIHVGSLGTFAPSGKHSTTPQDIDTLINHIGTQNISRIALYFHGGLVPEKAGMSAAQSMNTAIKTTNAYPISFVWETGLFKTLEERMKRIYETSLFKKLLGHAIKKAGAKLGFKLDAKGVGQLTDEEIAEELKNSEPFAHLNQDSDTRGQLTTEIKDEKEFKRAIEAQLREDLAWEEEEFKEILANIDLEQDLVNPTLILETNKENSDQKGLGDIFDGTIGFLVKIIWRTIKRFISKRDHGFYATIVEEILRALYLANFGAWVWGGMKTKAKEIWQSNSGLSGLAQHVGTYFLTQLNQLASRKNIHLDLIGHSAGSIMICHLLNGIKANYPNLKIKNLILLAPACTAKLFHSHTLANADLFERFRMFTMTDKAECDDALVDKAPFLYPRSLLYLISGILENKGESFDEPILGMYRYINRPHYYNNDQQLLDIRNYLLAPNKNRLVLSPILGNLVGLNSMAIDHGDFDNDQTTLSSIVTMIKTI